MLMIYQKLSAPPIIESILLVRFIEVLTEEQINAFCNDTRIISGYNTTDESGDPESASTDKVLRAKGSPDDDYANAIRITLDSLSFHKLEYSTFEELYDEFEAVLRILCSIAEGVSFDSLNLRFLNSIHLPSRKEEFRADDYLNYRLELPFAISNIFLQFTVMNEEDREMTGLVVQTTRKGKDASNDVDPGLLLDITVRKKVTLNGGTIEGVKDTFFSMRNFKNYIFFTVVRPDILEMYK